MMPKRPNNRARKMESFRYTTLRATGNKNNTRKRTLGTYSNFAPLDANYRQPRETPFLSLLTFHYVLCFLFFFFFSLSSIGSYHSFFYIFICTIFFFQTSALRTGHSNQSIAFHCVFLHFTIIFSFSPCTRSLFLFFFTTTLLPTSSLSFIN